MLVGGCGGEPESRGDERCGYKGQGRLVNNVSATPR